MLSLKLKKENFLNLNFLILSFFFVFSIYASFYFSELIFTYAFVSIISIFLCIASFIFLICKKYLYSFFCLLYIFPFYRIMITNVDYYFLFSDIKINYFIIRPLCLVVLFYCFVFFVQSIKAKNSYCHFKYRNFINLCYWLFFLFSLIATILALNKEISMFGFIIEVIFFPCFFYIVRKILNKRNDYVLFFYLLYFFLVIRTFFDYYQFFKMSNVTGLKININLWNGVDSHVEMIVILSVFSLIFSLGMMSISKKYVEKVLFIIIMSINVWFLCVCNKSEPFVSLLLTSPFMLFFTKNKKTYICFIICLLVFIFFNEKHIARFSSFYKFMDSEQMRITTLFASIKMICENFWFGIGFGNFAYFLDTFSEKHFFESDLWPLSNPHNFICHYLVSMGILATSCFIIIISYILIKSMNSIRLLMDNKLKNITVTVLWSFVCYIIGANIGGTAMPLAFSHLLVDTKFFFIELGFLDSMISYSKMNYKKIYNANNKK